MMARTSKQYWEDRWLSLTIQQERRIKPDIEKAKRLFKPVQDAFNDELEEWYQRYAENDELTYNQVRKHLTRIEQRNWNMELSEFRQKAIDGGYEQILNREYFKSRITRLEMLKAQSVMHLTEMAVERESLLKDLLINEFEENYMRSIYEIHSQSGKILESSITADFGTYNPREIVAVIHNDWKGSNFSKRVWKNDTEWLPDQLEKTLTKGLKSGHSYDKMAKDLNQRFDVARGRAVTLVQTEAKHVRTQASLAAMREEGIVQYIFVATLEKNTCEDCGNLDSEVIDVSKAVPGTNLPVIHPNCRCTIIPYIQEAFRTNTRWMRDPVTGEGRRIPRVTYKEWVKKYKEAA